MKLPFMNHKRSLAPVPETAVDRLLHRLGTAEVPEGLEDRVWAHLQDRMAEGNDIPVLPAPSTISPWSVLLSFPKGICVAASCATAVLWITIALAPKWANHRPQRSEQPVARQKGPSSPLVLPQPHDRQSRSTATRTNRQRDTPVRSINEAGTVTTQQGPPSDVLSTTALVEDQAALDTRTPSFPAPPLPLTAQERLLLHILHRDGSLDVAQLQNLRPSADDRAAFHAFFDPPAPPQPEATQPNLHPVATQGDQE